MKQDDFERVQEFDKERQERIKQLTAQLTDDIWDCGDNWQEWCMKD